MPVHYAGRALFIRVSKIKYNKRCNFKIEILALFFSEFNPAIGN